MAYSDNAKKRGRSRRVGSYQQGQNNPESTGQPVQGNMNKPLFNKPKSGGSNSNIQKAEQFSEQLGPNQGTSSGTLISEDTSEGTFKTKVSECVWKGILNGDTFKDAKKKCNG